MKTIEEMREKARAWLKSAKRCIIVTVAPGYLPGRPIDAFGWRTADDGTLVLCVPDREELQKIKDAQYIKEKYTIGTERIMMVPERCDFLREIPPGWGILSPFGNGYRLEKKPTTYTHDRTLARHENKLMFSLLKKSEEKQTT